jgi:hypothetical protein
VIQLALEVQSSIWEDGNNTVNGKTFQEQNEKERKERECIHNQVQRTYKDMPVINT